MDTVTLVMEKWGFEWNKKTVIFQKDEGEQTKAGMKWISYEFTRKEFEEHLGPVEKVNKAVIEVSFTKEEGDRSNVLYYANIIRVLKAQRNP